MEKFNQNESINIADIVNDGETVMESPAGLIVSDEDFTKMNEKKTTKSDEEYTGKGIIIEKKNPLENAIIGGVTPDTNDSVSDYIAEQNKQIEEAKKVKELMEKKGITPEMLPPKKGRISPHKIDREALKKAETPTEIVNIYLDGTDVGKIELSDEVKQKLEFADTVKLITSSNLYGIKIARDSSIEERNTVREKAFDKTLSPFIALGSGYMGKMGNCSTSDFLKLGRAIDSGANYQSQLERWQLLYEKMKYCSIGNFESFDDFLKGTAYDDYENLQFALICASLPEETTLSFKCPDCGQSFTFSVKNKDLLRTELVNEDMKDYVTKIVEADTFIERAQEVYKEAPFNKITRISLNGDKDLSIIMDLYAPSAYDVIHRVFEGIPQKYYDNEDYAPYISLVNLVKGIYIAREEPDETGEYIYDAFESPEEILETLVRFNEPQLNKITLYINETYLSHKYYYGIKKVTCPNPECNHDFGEYAMNMDQLLFLKLHRQ